MADLDLRCSTLTREMGERPGGSAGSWHRVILIELPLPWPDSIEDHPLLRDVTSSGSAIRSHRLLALAATLDPDEAAPDDGFRVICYWRAVEAPFSRFTRAEVCSPAAELADTINQLILAEDEDLAGIPAGAFSAGRALDAHAVRDLLVCTHGHRDRCCGKLGTELFRELEDQVPSGVRLWRTSHTGGHRFAPTGVTFPDGGMWAGMDASLALGLIDRTIPASAAAERARGSVGVPAGAAQVADAAGLAAVGWSWVDQERTVSVAGDAEAATVTLDVGDQRIRAVVRQGREVPIPLCGVRLDEATKTTTEWLLESFEEI